ncbi:hypothetical protein B566_EDAN001426 [Ephemera danica]|nr:hypothetical protein B566_EDAN001426 [Ephemera danica]
MNSYSTQQSTRLGELIPVTVPEEVLVLDATRPEEVPETASVPEVTEPPSCEATPEALVLDDTVEVISIAVPNRVDQQHTETHTRLVPIPEEAPVESDMTEEGEQQQQQQHASSVPTSTSTPSTTTASLVAEMPAQAAATIETTVLLQTTQDTAAVMAEEEEVQQPPSDDATIKGKKDFVWLSWKPSLC